MLVTTTPNLEGHRILSYIGLVSAEAILGANMFKDMMAGVRNAVGGRSVAYEDEMRKAKEFAIGEMAEQARMLGANAVIAVALDYETVGRNGGMLMVCACGTAVVFE